MSLFALAAGTLIADPQRREGTKTTFGTATLRVAADDAEKILVSISRLAVEALVEKFPEAFA
jgi:hypothetical protein